MVLITCACGAAFKVLVRCVYELLMKGVLVADEACRCS